MTAPSARDIVQRLRRMMSAADDATLILDHHFDDPEVDAAAARLRTATNQTAHMTSALLELLERKARDS